MCFCEMFRCLVGDCGVVGDLLGFWVVGARDRFICTWWCELGGLDRYGDVGFGLMLLCRL